MFKNKSAHFVVSSSFSRLSLNTLLQAVHRADGNLVDHQAVDGKLPQEDGNHQVDGNN